MKKTKRSKNPGLSPSALRSRLFEASVSGNLLEVKLYIQEGADPNICDKDGFTPLMFAITNGDPRVTAYLIEHGSDVNMRNIVGQTSLMLAALGGHRRIVEQLVRAGADVQAVDQEKRSVLAWAASRGDFPEVISVLATFGANPDMPDIHGITPLMRAALLGYVESVAVLLTLGADSSAKFQGKTAYQMADEKHHDEVCRTMKIVLKNHLQP